MSFGQDDWQVLGYYDETIQEASHWLSENTTVTDHIITDSWWTYLFYFNLDARHPIYGIKNRTLISSITPGKEINFSRLEPLSSFLFVWWKQVGVPNGTSMLALSQSELLAQIRELGIDYVVVIPDNNYLSLYLSANPSFEEIKQFGKGKVRIFKVQSQPQPIPFPTHIESSLPTFLQELAEDNPRLYETFMGDYVLKEVEVTTLKEAGASRPADIDISQLGFETFKLGQN